MVIDGAWHLGKNTYKAGRFIKKAIHKVKDKKRRMKERRADARAVKGSRLGNGVLGGDDI